MKKPIATPWRALAAGHAWAADGVCHLESVESMVRVAPRGKEVV